MYKQKERRTIPWQQHLTICIQNTCIIPYKDWVIVAYANHKGIGVEIYETLDSLEVFENAERRFVLTTKSEGAFEDQGHAVKWAFEQIGG